VTQMPQRLCCPSKIGRRMGYVAASTMRVHEALMIVCPPPKYCTYMDSLFLAPDAEIVTEDIAAEIEIGAISVSVPSDDLNLKPSVRLP